MESGRKHLLTNRIKTILKNNRTVKFISSNFELIYSNQADLRTETSTQLVKFYHALKPKSQTMVKSVRRIWNGMIYGKCS